MQNKLRDPERLAALQRSGLLDTPPEEAFDRVTRLAARCLGAPIAMVSLVDADRQFLKSTVGLEEPWASRREIPLEYSYCRLGLGSTEPLVVEDTRTDPLTQGTRAIERGVVAYAGVPLTDDGEVLGMLCVMDRAPRRWSAEEVGILRDLAAMAQTEVDLRHAERQAREGQTYLNAIIEAQQSLSGTRLDLDAVMPETVKRTSILTNAGAVAVELDDGEGRICRAASGSAETHLGRPLGIVAPAFEPLLHEGLLLQSADTETDERVDREACRAIGARSVVVVPLTDAERMAGTLTIASPHPDAFSRSEVHTVELLASLVSSALRDARRLARKRELLAQLRESEELYRSVIEGAAEGFFLVALEEDGTLRYQMMNRALTRIIGIPPERFVGRTPEEALPPEVAARVALLLRQVLETGAPAEVERTSELLSGAVTTRTRLYPLTDERGTVIRILGIAEDTTEQLRSRRLAEVAAAEARLNLSRLETVLHVLPVGVFITDPSGKVEVANPAAEQLWGGHTPRVGIEAYGEYRARHAESGTPVAPEEWPLARAIRTGEAVLDREVEIEGFDGSRRTVIASGLRIHDDAGHVAGGVGVIVDITVRKQAEEALRESRSRFQTAFRDAPIGMALVGLDGEWLEVNQALSRMTGYADEEMRAMTFADITYPDDLEADLAYVRELVAGTIASYQMEKRYVHRDGHLVWIQLTVSLVRRAGGEPLYFISQIQDVTERHRSEERLREYARELERSNRELADFAYVASHDLQEPLRKIQAFGDRLHDRCHDALGEQGADYLRRMQSAAARMQALIQDLLTYSRVSSKAQPFAQVELGDVAREVASDLQARVEATGGSVEVGPLPRLWADPLQMRQLFQNLLGNALKFHREGVPPRVRLSSAPAGGGAFRIRVEDNGIGFRPEFAERIFTLFERLHGRSEYEGTGMGLAICRKIAERHQGSIVAESVPGEGTAFIVTLPAGAPQTER